jgi:hypothetical protein
MTRTGIESEDVHNFERRYENALRLLHANRKILPENREKILEFLTHCKAKELRKARQLFYLQRLTTIASILRSKRFVDAARADLEKVFAKLGERQGRDGKALAPWTTWGYKVAAKVF